MERVASTDTGGLVARFQRRASAQREGERAREGVATRLSAVRLSDAEWTMERPSSPPVDPSAAAAATEAALTRWRAVAARESALPRTRG
jgi:hypothetical protein